MLALPVPFLVLGLVLVLVKELEVRGVLWGLQVVEPGQKGQQMQQQVPL